MPKRRRSRRPQTPRYEKAHKLLRVRKKPATTSQENSAPKDDATPPTSNAPENTQNASSSSETVTTTITKPKTKPTEGPRCVFFPKCTKENCPFFHPSEPCKNPLTCVFGPLVCRYIHPPCKFGPRCTRPDCAYTHPKEAMYDCKNGFSCPNKANCAYRHPPEACFFRPRCRNQGFCLFSHAPPCQFGSACRIPGCTFSHKSASPEVDDATLDNLSSTLPKTPPTENNNPETNGAEQLSESKTENPNSQTVTQTSDQPPVTTTTTDVTTSEPQELEIEVV